MDLQKGRNEMQRLLSETAVSVTALLVVSLITPIGCVYSV